MGAYAYCQVCHASMSEPTLRQALRAEKWSCTRCGTEREPLHTKDESLLYALEEMLERIQKIEDHIWPDHSYE